MSKRELFELAIGLTFIVLLSAMLAGASPGKFYNNQELAEKSEVCLNCHDDQAASLKGSAHEIVTKGGLGSVVGVGCIGCHDGWEKHVEEPTVLNITNPANLSFSDQAKVCSHCHADPHQSAMVSTDPHSRVGVTCLNCHTVHNNKNKGLVKEESDNFCLTCHATVAAEFHQRSVHPLNSGNIRCIDCHYLSRPNDPMFVVGLDWTCQKCHTDKSGPFPFEHPVVYKHLVNGGGCLECHQPHGSPNDRLLNQPNNGACLQCHEIPSLHFTQHSGLGTKLECVFCHTDIHGSYDNGKFLDPELGTKLFPDCFQSGCHIFKK